MGAQRLGDRLRLWRQRHCCGVSLGGARIGSGLGFFVLNREVVVADLNEVAIGHLHLAGDAVAVDANTVVAAQVFDEHLGLLTNQFGMTARHVSLGQPNGVAFLPTDRDFVPYKGNDGFSALVVFDDQLEHARKVLAPLQPGAPKQITRWALVGVTAKSAVRWPVRMADLMTVRSEAGDEVIDVAEFESRVMSGELSPQTLVCWPVLTGDRFVQACDLSVYQQLHEPKRAYFRRAFSLSRCPWLTSGVILLNIAVFLATAHAGTLSVDDMVLSGGKVSPLVADLGQLYRLLTANLLHRDAIHLGLNLFVFFNVGGVLENTYRTLDYLWLLVVAGVATFATSMLINDSITVGSSGMVFGCLGGLVAFGLKHRSLLPARYRNLLGDAPIPTVGGFLLIGLSSRGVDNGAHIGGLMAGLLTGLFLRPRLLAETRHFWWEPGLRALPSLGLLALVVFGETVVGDLLPRWRVERDETYLVKTRIGLNPCQHHHILLQQPLFRPA